MKAWLTVAALAGAAMMAGGAAAAEAPPPKSCADAHAHELDFWIGEWEIHHAADGKLSGRTRIRQIDGCVLREEWTGLTETGGSLNAYDPDAKIWRRLWAGMSANVGDYIGRWTDGGMEFTGQGSTKGVPVSSRLRLTPMPDGRVHQQFDTRQDGQDWKPFVDSYYVRVGG